MYSLLQHLKFWILSRQCVTNCVWLPQQTRAVFLYNSHQLVFIKQTSRVFCEVGTQFSSFLQTSPYQVFWIIRDVPTFFIPTRQRSKFVGLPIGDLCKWNVQCRHCYRLYNSDTWIETPTSESSPTGSNFPFVFPERIVPGIRRLVHTSSLFATRRGGAVCHVGLNAQNRLWLFAVSLVASDLMYRCIVRSAVGTEIIREDDLM